MYIPFFPEAIHAVSYQLRHRKKNALMSALKADDIDILVARPMGRKGTVLTHIAFEDHFPIGNLRGFLTSCGNLRSKVSNLDSLSQIRHKACRCPFQNILLTNVADMMSLSFLEPE